jgi:hypothetical protein
MVGLGPAGWSLLRELLLRCFLGGSFCAALLSFSLLLGGLLRFVAAGGAGGARWVGILGSRARRLLAFGFRRFVSLGLGGLLLLPTGRVSPMITSVSSSSMISVTRFGDTKAPTGTTCQ